MLRAPNVMASKEAFIPRKVWSNQEIQTIINVVRARPYLYNKKHQDYKHSQKKETAWEEISKILKNKTARECKRKWNTLRIQQRRIIIQRMKKKGRLTQWHCFNMLQFLVPHMEWTSATNLDFEKKQASDDEEFEEHSIDFEDSKACLAEEQIISDTPIDNSDNIDVEGNSIYIQEIHNRCVDDHDVHSANENEEQVDSKQIPFVQMQEVDHTTEDEDVDDRSRGVIQQNVPEDLIHIMHHSSDDGNTVETSVVTNNDTQYYMTTDSLTQEVVCPDSPPSATADGHERSGGTGVGDRLGHNTSICSSDLQFGTHSMDETTAGNHITNNMILRQSPHGNDPTSSTAAGQSIAQTMSSIALNYFLMDIQIQMDKLNEIAQMELKIEIQKLLLDKLRNSQNYTSPYQRND